MLVFFVFVSVFVGWDIRIIKLQSAHSEIRDRTGIHLYMCTCEGGLINRATGGSDVDAWLMAARYQILYAIYHIPKSTCQTRAVVTPEIQNGRFSRRWFVYLVLSLSAGQWLSKCIAALRIMGLNGGEISFIKLFMTITSQNVVFFKIPQYKQTVIYDLRL